MLFNNNPYQHHIYLTSANSIAASIYKSANNVTGYFNLKEINEDLLKRNSDLELELINLRNKYRTYADYDSTSNIDSRYSFTLAHVINNSTLHQKNYITLDRGSLDGIEPEMGILDQNGIVGIVNIVGPHYSRAISLLNSMFRLSCKVKNHDYVGSLVWDGENPTQAILEELPRHSVYKKGDTIITSGFSTVFPEGIPVGTVIEEMKDYDENFHALKIKLFTNFETLNTVRIIKDNMRNEIKSVESNIMPESKFNSRRN